MGVQEVEGDNGDDDGGVCGGGKDVDSLGEMVSEFVLGVD